MSEIKKDIVLMPSDRDIIIRGEWLSDIHMENFHRLLQNCSDYRPVETWRIQCLDTIQPVQKNKKHIQILHSSSGPLDGHWICSYYDTKNIFIYDSLNSKKLHKQHEQFLRKLFPTYNFEKHQVKFPIVQHQINGNDCGVFAIAFAVSLLFNIKPEKVKYDHSLMRLHLITIFESNVIEHFPQDLRYGAPQKVFSLTVLKAREFERIRIRAIRQCETEEQKSKQLQKKRDIRKFNKELNNNQLKILNVVKQSTEIVPNTHIETNSFQNCFRVEDNIGFNIDNSNVSSNNDDKDNNVDICKINKDCESKRINKCLQHENNMQLGINKCLQNEHNMQLEDISEERYQRNLENKRLKNRFSYTQNLETNRAKKRHQYEQNLEDIRGKKRHRYEMDLENNRAKKRRQYEQNLEDIRDKKKHRYEMDLENNRAKKRNQYAKDIIKQRIQKRVHYNKRYYQKKCSKFMSTIKNNITKNIIKKYEKFRSKNSIKIRGSLGTFIENITKKLTIKDNIAKRLEAEKIVRWCMRIRNGYVCNVYKILALLKKKTEVCLTLVTEYSEINEKLHILCGMSRHTASSENYFVDSTYYEYVTSSESLMMNTEGQIVNVLPLIEAQAKKSWLCSTLCKVDDPILIDRYQKFLEAINVCTLKNVPKLIQNTQCTVKTKTTKLGHSHSCYIDPTICKGISLPLQLLSPHFPKVRDIRRLIYQLIAFYRKILNVDKALTAADLDTLNKMVILAQEKEDMYKHRHTDYIFSDDDIILKYQNAFKALTKRSMDTPRYVCVSCQRLCYKRSVSVISTLRAQMDIPIWRDLMAYVKQRKMNSQYICNYCDKKFRNDIMPAYCILNNLFVDDVPEVISSLNSFEKILIQRAKAFQTVLKMGTVMNKKLPHRQMIQKVKGRTFHLPLPLQETLNKLCSNTDPINMNHELYILVRGIPTKSKIIWEEMVNIKKIFDALVWLKKNNPLYSHIILPKIFDELYLKKLNVMEFQVQQEENDNETESNDEDESLDNMELQKQEIKNRSEATLNDERKALITQVINDEKDDNYYEQYTIYPLYEKKANMSATALYQMLKIQDESLDNRTKHLDLLCFPDLFPFGLNGQHESRQVKLHDHEFIKCRLTSKYSQYRLNQQYLFYLLNDANIRQLSRGIYHKMNVTNPRVRYTAAEYLEAMSKELLESNLSTIFSTLRNTEQYWRKPRSDLNCMTQHYGPATWFLTLSPSEWLWEDLGEYIREVNGWHDSSLCINTLVAKDPVSTSRFLDNKLRAMLDFICSKDNPIGEVTHYFWRREYQGRGVQHFHLLIWIKNAPILGESSNEEVGKFILQYITCKMPDRNISPLLYRRVNTHQRHKHNAYCLRNKKVGRAGRVKVTRICRFGFPRPVTETLNMRDVISSIAGRKRLKHKSRLYDLPRTDDEVNINDYNPALLTAWEGNMDIQFIGEKSTILTWYVTKYMNKAGKSELSDPILTSKNNENKSLGSYLWNIALRFTNNRECGALEASDTLLGIPLYGTDRNTTIRWLDVNQIRYRKLKNRKEIEALDGESTDIFFPSLIDNHYPHRPEELKSMSLYEFAQWYDITKIKPRSKNIEYYKIANGYYIKRRQRKYLINHYRYDVNTQPENYFFALLLMFKPWRKLEDLRRDCENYAESFHKVKLHLESALQYHEKLEELKKAFETAQQLVQQCLDDDLEKQHMSQDDPENPIGVQNIEAGEAMQDFRDLGNKLEIDISQMISQLNVDQKRVFDKVINTITSEDKSILRLYVSGEGGTGKSFLIKTIKCWIRQNLNKDTAVAAPTGIAAFNIDGLTVHRLFQLPVEHGYIPKYKQLSDHVLKVLRADLKDVILLVIDEVSMISNLVLMYIHLRLSEIFDTSNCDDGWFGRKHILLFGDLLQLPPVNEDPAFVELSKEKIDKYLASLSAPNLWITLFDYDELTINMRQQGDESYRQLLSRIRVGILTKSDSEILESRKISFKDNCFQSRLNEICSFIDGLPSDTVCLLPTCNMCDVLNAAMLSRIPLKEILLIAEDTIDCVQYIKQKVLRVLSNNDDDNTKTGGLSKQITIKIGAKVMIRRNIDASLGLVNGTIAKIISVTQDTNSNYVEKIKLLLLSGLEYTIERVSVKFQVMDKAYVVRKQFPLSLSYGITIHKSQGLSLQNAIIDIGNAIFNCGQVYVALSRLTSLDGLHLINYDPSSIKANEEAIIEYNRLKRIYKLETDMITVSKKRYRKVADIPWALSKAVVSVQESHEKIRQSIWIIHGFQNTDNVSCYANAALQCILHLNTIRKQLFNCDKSDVLRILAHRYENGMNNLNTYAIRQSLGEYFSINVKRDAIDFLTALCTKYDCIRNLVEHQITSTTRCKTCNNTQTATSSNIILSIPINNLMKKSYNLNDLLNNTFSHWCQSNNESCEHCTESDILSKKELTLVREIVVIHFTQDCKLRKTCKFNLIAVPTTKILINGQFYKVINAIFHRGLSLEDSHYTNICREGTSNTWIEVDDTKVKKRQWPRGAQDICVLFLQKIANK